MKNQQSSFWERSAETDEAEAGVTEISDPSA